MTMIRNTAFVLTSVVLGACSSTSTPVAFTPSIDQTASVDPSGSYSVTQVNVTAGGLTETVTKSLGPANATLSGTAFLAFTATSFGVAYKTADVLAIAGMDQAAPRATYAGISGTPSTTVPTSGSGTYNGNFNMSYYRGGTTNSTWWAHGAFTTTVDFNAGTLSGSGVGAAGGSAGASLSVTGNLNGVHFNGTADFTAPDFAGATNVPMTGGFYGANTVAGILQNGEVAGVFYGQ